MVLRLERSDLVCDAKKIREEVLEMRRDVDEQRRFVLERQGSRDPAGRVEPIGQRGIGIPEVRDEQPVDAAGTVDRVQVGKFEAVSERQHGIADNSWPLRSVFTVAPFMHKSLLFYLSGPVRRHYA